jgi:Sulfotransferase family
MAKTSSSTAATGLIADARLGTRRLGARVARQGLRVLSPLPSRLNISPPPQPIFLLGCPRSGTSLLSAILRLSPEVRGLRGEGHVLWEALHHPKYHRWDSNALHASDATDADRAFFSAGMRAIAGGRRFLDKTPKNSLRIAYLAGLFPDADFVFLRRRGADNINSLIEGWRVRPRFVTYALPSRFDRRRQLAWSFVLIPGWRDLEGAPVEEICAHQYIACNEAALAGADFIDPCHWTSIRYEDLVAQPEEELGRLVDRLGLAFTTEMERVARELEAMPINIVSPPKQDKWRTENPVKVGRILPLIAETERKLGYESVAVG